MILRRAVALLVVVMAGVAWAAGEAARGWTTGEPAVNTSRVLTPVTETPSPVNLPKEVMARLDRATLLFYFSPRCPHCTHVTPEVASLHGRLVARGAKVLGVASSSSDPTQIEAWKKTYGVAFEVLHDKSGAIGSAMGARSTPSAILVTLDEGGTPVLADLLYPYVPGFDLFVEMRLEANPWSAFRPGEFQGDRACAMCHVQEQESWLLTHHAGAWRTLERDGHHTDAACTNCHVTGASAGGWSPGNTDLVNVQCEACHGPGGPHDGQRTDAAAQCETCHDKKHSIGFDPALAIPMIDHFAANTLSDDEWRARRKAVVLGELPQRLFAFETGAYVGSSTCETCHASAHASGDARSHGQAMAHLEGASREDVACVRCHATPKTVGLPGTSVDAFRTEEGVGCESCHGPGARHAETRSVDDIVGLGESCPVCVIEAVCTSCHTSEWDSDWDLDAALKKIRRP